MYACTINPKFPALGSGAGRSGKMKPAFGESLQQGPDLKRNPSTNDVQRPYYPRSLKKLIIWISSLSGVLAKINDKQKGDTDRQSWANLLTVPPPPTLVQMGTGPGFRGEGPLRGRQRWVLPQVPKGGAPGVVVGLAESRAEEMLLSRETESPRQRSRHPISPPAPPSSPHSYPYPHDQWKAGVRGRGWRTPSPP